MGKGGWSTKPVGGHVALSEVAVDRWLAHRGWSRRELARRASRLAELRGERPISQSYMHQLVSGRVPCDERKWRLIAAVLDVLPEVLLEPARGAA